MRPAQPSGFRLLHSLRSPESRNGDQLKIVGHLASGVRPSLLGTAYHGERMNVA